MIKNVKMITNVNNDTFAVRTGGTGFESDGKDGMGPRTCGVHFSESFNNNINNAFQK